MTTRPRCKFTVEAHRADRFPMDMLRYDEAWPATEEDALLIQTLNGQEDAEILKLPPKVRVTLYTNQPQPTLARWASFMVRVVAYASISPGRGKGIVVSSVTDWRAMSEHVAPPARLRLVNHPDPADQHGQDGFPKQL